MTEEKVLEAACDCADMYHDFEAMRRRDEELAKLIEQSRQLGPMTSEKQREQRISWVYGNCKLSNPDITREMVENAVDFGPAPTHTDRHPVTLLECEAPVALRPVSAYADDEPPLDPPTQEDLDARRKWADRYVAVASGTETHITDCDVKPSLEASQDVGEHKLSFTLTIPVAVSPSEPPYQNPLAALRRERKVKSGKAAKLLGISRQRLHVVEHATKPLRCMGRLLAKATMVWPVVDETTTKATSTASHKGSH